MGNGSRDAPEAQCTVAGCPPIPPSHVIVEFGEHHLPQAIFIGDWLCVHYRLASSTRCVAGVASSASRSRAAQRALGRVARRSTRTARATRAARAGVSCRKRALALGPRSHSAERPAVSAMLHSSLPLHLHRTRADRRAVARRSARRRAGRELTRAASAVEFYFHAGAPNPSNCAV